MNINTILFDYVGFLDELFEKEDTQHIILQYESIFGKIPNDIGKCEFFRNYLRFIDPIDYNVPNILADDFNWELLLQLTVCSFSSSYQLKEEDGKVELYITVSSNGIEVTKKVSELWSFQILRLFEIYIEEQLNLGNLLYEDACSHKRKRFPKSTLASNCIPTRSDYFSLYSKDVLSTGAGYDIWCRYDKLQEYDAKSYQFREIIESIYK